jgi:RNA recognition motif-containing protein
VDVNLVRDKSSGKPKGYGFLCYEDQRSTILAVDNLNGIKVCNLGYRIPKSRNNYVCIKGEIRINLLCSHYEFMTVMVQKNIKKSQRHRNCE